MKLKFVSLLLMVTAVSICHAQTINAIKLDSLLQKAEQTHSEAVIIYDHNKLLVEKYFGIGKPDQKIETMSCTKSIVGVAVACLLSDGLIDSLDIPVSKYYPELRQGQKKDITIRHLVNMTSGIQNNPNATIEIYPSSDFVQLALAAELASKPGEVFSYNNKSLNLLAGVIKKITGKRMDIFIRERLFNPLGIKDFTWTLDDAGNPHVMSGCQIKPSDFVKIGNLVLQKGNYNGKQVVAEKYIDEMVSPCSQFQGYGMLWWIDYEYTSAVIDDEMLVQLTNAQVSPVFMEKFSRMKGSYDSFDAYSKKLFSLFGERGREEIAENLDPKKLRYFKLVRSGAITYRAEGYLGNYIIVDPRTDLVAIRMISDKSFKMENDNFFDFGKLVLDLKKNKGY